MGTQISKAGGEAAVQGAADLQKIAAKRQEQLQKATAQASARLRARDQRIADIGDRLKAEGLKDAKARETRRRKAVSAEAQEAQFRQAAQQQRLSELKAAANGAADKFGSNAKANRTNVAQQIAQDYAVDNAKAEKSKTTQEPTAAEAVLEAYGLDDPLKDLALINAEKARLASERKQAVERQELSKTNATQAADKQRELYEFELQAVEEERLTAEANNLDDQTADAIERLEQQKAFFANAQASNNSFADAREVLIKNNEKKTDAKRLQVFEQRREDIQKASALELRDLEEAIN